MARSNRNVASDMAALRERDPGFLCAYCSIPLVLPLPQASTEHLAWEQDGWELSIPTEGEPYWHLLDGRAPAHREHVDPVSKGGADSLDNLVLACERCNVTKGTKPLVLFLAAKAGVPRFRSVGADYSVEFARSWSGGL